MAPLFSFPPDLSSASTFKINRPPRSHAAASPGKQLNMVNVDTMHNHHPAPDGDTSPPAAAAASSSDGTNQPMVVDPSPEGGTNSNDGTMAIASDAKTLLPLPDKFNGCTVLNGKCIFAEGRGRFIHGGWAVSTPEYNKGYIESFEFDSVAKTDELFSTKGAKFVGRFVNYGDLVDDEFTIRSVSSSDNCIYIEGTGQNELYESSYNIVGKLSGNHLTMVRFPQDSAIAMEDGERDDEEGEGDNHDGDGDECWAPDDAEAHLTEERPSPTKLSLGHTISLKGQLQIFTTTDGEVVAKLQGRWAEHYRMLRNVDACQSFSYESNTAPPHEGKYVGTFSSTGMGGDLQQCDDSFYLFFSENSDGNYNVDGQGYNDLAGEYSVSGTMSGDDIIMQRRLIVLNNDGTKRVQSEAKLPSTAEVKEPGKGSKRRKKGKDGGTKTDKSGGNVISKVKDKAKKAAAKVVAKLSRKPDISQCTLVDPPAELVTRYAPWLDQAVKVFCPIAHPEKATTTCTQVGDMLWVCVFCMQQKKGLSKGVKDHLRSKHLDEYNRLYALESAIQQQEPSAPGTLVDPPAELVAKFAPWLDQAVKVFCPIAHPKKAITASTQTRDMVWVCVFCMQQMKGLKKQNVQKHFRSMHLEEYNKLCALEASIEEAVLVDVISSDYLLQEYFQIYPVKSHPQFEELAHCTLCGCNCPLDGIHEHVSRCHPKVWDSFQKEVLSNEQPLLSSVTEEESNDNTNFNVAHCIKALQPRHQEVYNNILGGGMKKGADAWDELFKSDENTREEYLKDIGQSRGDGDQSQSDSSEVLASIMRSKATFHSCFPSYQHSRMDFLHLLQVACDEHPHKISVIMSDRIPSFFKTARMDTDLLGKYAIQIADIVAFKLVLKLVWGNDDMKYFIQVHEKRGFTVGCFDNMCYLSHPNMHESDLSKLDLVVSKDYDRLMAMTKERDEWKKYYEESEARCIALQEELRQCQSEIEELRLRATALHMPVPELPRIEEL